MDSDSIAYPDRNLRTVHISSAALSFDFLICDVIIVDSYGGGGLCYSYSQTGYSAVTDCHTSHGWRHCDKNNLCIMYVLTVAYMFIAEHIRYHIHKNYRHTYVPPHTKPINNRVVAIPIFRTNKQKSRWQYWCFSIELNLSQCKLKTRTNSY